jgi:hypothetical protein
MRVVSEIVAVSFKDMRYLNEKINEILYVLLGHEGLFWIEDPMIPGQRPNIGIIISWTSKPYVHAEIGTRGKDGRFMVATVPVYVPDGIGCSDCAVLVRELVMGHLISGGHVRYGLSAGNDSDEKTGRLTLDIHSPTPTKEAD